MHKRVAVTVRISLVVLLCALLSVPAPIARALTIDKALNDIEFYDENACANGNDPSSSSTGTMQEGSAKVEPILSYLTNKGLTLNMAAGFAGNMKQESGWEPRVIGGGKLVSGNYIPINGQAFGLVQWTFSARQKPLVELAQKTNRNTTDLGLQMDYVWQEITTTHKDTLARLIAKPNVSAEEAAVIVHGGRTSHIQSSIGNISDADSKYVWYFHDAGNGYEVSADTAQDVINKRAKPAAEIANTYRGKIADGDPSKIQLSGSSVATATTASGVTNSCNQTGTGVTADCPVTKPIYGEGGNSHQLTRTELISLYGQPRSSADMIDVDFLGKKVQIHEKVAGCLAAVAAEIKAKNVNYTIKTIGGFRQAVGGGQVADGASYHQYGAAIDINPNENPCCSVASYDMPKEYIDAFHNHGWSWGGNWRTLKDYMHFEFNGLSLSGGGVDTR